MAPEQFPLPQRRTHSSLGQRLAWLWWSPHAAVTAQILLVVIFTGTAAWLLTNLNDNLNRMGTGFGFEVLRESAGFPISETLPLPGWEYTTDSSYWDALAAGLLNTIKVSAPAIALATAIGFVVGALRLYGLPELQAICRWYVMLIRGLPVLLQLVIWYTLIVGYLPSVAEGFHAVVMGTTSEGGPIHALHLNNRGLFLAYPRWDAMAPGGWLWETPLPTFGGRNLSGGLHLTPEFLALFVGLGLYTSAFVAEAVRGGLQAVDNGQREAAAALGLTTWQTLRLIVAPQAWKIIVPPLTSLVLSLIKNSSLAVAVGYPDLVAVGGTILNQTGRSIEVILVWMGVYLTLSILISLFLNRRRQSQLQAGPVP